MIQKKKLKNSKKKTFSPKQQQADLARLRSLGVMPCAFAFRGSSSTSSTRFAPSVAGADDGALGSGVAGARCRLVPWSENAAPVLLVPIPVREKRESRGRGGGGEGVAGALFFCSERSECAAFFAFSLSFTRKRIRKKTHPASSKKKNKK